MADEKMVWIARVFPDGSIRKLHGAADEARYGAASRRRASYVEPVTCWRRWVFHCIRRCVADDSLIAEWTRAWPGPWRARIFNGPILGPFDDRAAAISAEQEWLIINWICAGDI